MTVTDLLRRVDETVTTIESCEDGDGTEIETVIDDTRCEGDQTIVRFHGNDLNFGYLHRHRGEEINEGVSVVFCFSIDSSTLKKPCVTACS